VVTEKEQSATDSTADPVHLRSDVQLRIECLDFAIRTAEGSQSVIALAAKYFEFVKQGTVESSKD